MIALTAVEVFAGAVGVPQLLIILNGNELDWPKPERPELELQLEQSIPQYRSVTACVRA